MAIDNAQRRFVDTTLAYPAKLLLYYTEVASFTRNCFRHKFDGLSRFKNCLLSEL
ncbi:MAG: hypothetical protein ACJAWQ_000595 [Paraglaciecola sp.]|jgi:hypothetical protein